jgi:hypothetical protein
METTLAGLYVADRRSSATSQYSRLGKSRRCKPTRKASSC